MNKVVKKPLSELADIIMGQSPESESYNDKGDGIPFYQGKSDFGIVHPTVRMYCNSPKKIAIANDILMSVRAPIGDVNIAQDKCCIGRGLAAIRPKEHTNLKYLFYVLDYYKERLAKQGTGSTFKAIGKDILNEFSIPAWDSQTQQSIANTIDEIQELIFNRQEALSVLDELVKSRFVEMFGEPVTNPMGWESKSLLEMGDCKNGMNFHKGESGVELHCLGVGDFQNLSVIADTTELPTVSLNEMPSKDYLLQNEDIVFVRSNGNKNLVGRCVAVYPNDVLTVFSGFCIRFRLTDREYLTTDYLLHVLKHESMRQKMTGRGANIQNLNQQILSALEIPLPPIAIQNQFADFVAQADKSKFAIQQSIDTLQTLKAKLMQDYFG